MNVKKRARMRTAKRMWDRFWDDSSGLYRVKSFEIKVATFRSKGKVRKQIIVVNEHYLTDLGHQQNLERMLTGEGNQHVDQTLTVFDNVSNTFR